MLRKPKQDLNQSLVSTDSNAPKRTTLKAAAAKGLLKSSGSQSFIEQANSTLGLKNRLVKEPQTPQRNVARPATARGTPKPSGVSTPVRTRAGSARPALKTVSKVLKFIPLDCGNDPILQSLHARKQLGGGDAEAVLKEADAAKAGV